MRSLLRLLVLAQVSLAHADLYKCVSQDTTIYQERPCGPGKTSISMESDLSKRLRAAEAAKAAESLARQKQQEELERNRQVAVLVGQRKAEKCEALLNLALASKAESSVWGDPVLRHAANLRLMRIEETYARECSNAKR